MQDPATIEGHPVAAVMVIGDSVQEQVSATLDQMCRLIEHASSHPRIKAEAQALWSGEYDGGFWPCTGTKQYAQRVWQWVKERMRFREDQTAVATWQGAQVTEVLTHPADLSARADASGRADGDCDDYAIWVGALMRAMGMPYSLCVAAVAREHANYSHVFGVTYAEGERVSLDASHGPYLGWEVPHMHEAVNARFERDVTSSDAGMLGWSILAGFLTALFLRKYVYKQPWR